MRFGWTLAEVHGRLRQQILWPDPSRRLNRLFLSDLNPASGERFWVATKRLVYLAHHLFPPPEASPDESQCPPPGSVECPHDLNDLLERADRSIMAGRGKLPRTQATRYRLSQWSRQVWATLDAEDPLLSEAATLGARLADTFWQVRFPAKGQQIPDKESWKYMLKSRRTIATIRQVRPVEGHLPAHVGPMLRHSLWEWDIAGELTRSRSGGLEIIYPFLYHLRSVGWARGLRRRWMRGRDTSPDLTLEEEQALWKQLKSQMIVWEHMVFNRPLAQLLRPSDWRQTRWLTTQVVYAVIIVLVAMGGALLVGGIFRLVADLVGHFLPSLAAPTEFKDQLTLAGILVAVLGFLATQLRQALRRLRHLYDAIYTWVVGRKLEQRSLRPWNGQAKPLRWIWIQRLLRAEDT